MQRWRKYAFLALLGLPMMLVVIKRDPSFPLPKSLGEWFFFPGEFKYYVANLFPLRDSFAKIHSRTLHTVRGPSEVDAVLRGAEGWMFLRIKRENPLHGHKRHELNAFLAQYSSENAICRELGIEYRLLVVPSKTAVYPEFVPERFAGWIPRDNPMTPAGRFFKIKGDGFPIVDVLQRFRREKETCDLFFKTDAHWNEFGGLIATEELMATINPNREAAKFQIEARESKGGNEAKILGIQNDVTEFNPRIVLENAPISRFASGKPIIVDTINLVGFEKTAMRTKCPEAPLESAIVFHNSFGVALLPFVSRQFKDCVFIWHDFMPDAVREQKPDYVISLHTTF